MLSLSLLFTFFDISNFISHIRITHERNFIFSLTKAYFFFKRSHTAKAGYTKYGKELNDTKWNGMAACLFSYFTLRKVSYQLLY